MSAEFFLDTNILVYSFDQRFPHKQTRARELISRALTDRTGIISWQVVQEFINVARHKFATPLSLEELTTYLDQVLTPLCNLHSEPAVYRQALSVQLETQYRFYDCLIVAAASRAGCTTLYSEDLQHGREIGGLTIINPFGAIE